MFTKFIITASRVLFISLLLVSMGCTHLSANRMEYKNSAIEPERWIGTELPILNQVDIHNKISKGKWIVIFYRNCSRCLIAIDPYIASARQLAGIPNVPHMAFIEVPSSASQTTPVTSIQKGLVTGKLDYKMASTMRIPALIELDNAKVTKVQTNFSKLESRSDIINIFPPTIDLEQIKATETATGTIIIENMSTLPVFLSCTSGCGCTTAQLRDTILQPLQITELNVVFKPGYKKKYGKVEELVTLIASSDCKTQNIEIKVQAEVLI
jgi:hypothetical protein